MTCDLLLRYCTFKLLLSNFNLIARHYFDHSLTSRDTRAATASRYRLACSSSGSAADLHTIEPTLPVDAQPP